MASRRLIDLDPALQSLAQKFLDACELAGIIAFITQTYRSSEEQDVDYAKGRTTDGPRVTNARGGQSPHNCTLPDGTPAAKAFDFAIKTSTGILDWDATHPDWQRAIKIGTDLGLVSGSTFKNLKDSPHLELSYWKTPPVQLTKTV